MPVYPLVLHSGNFRPSRISIMIPPLFVLHILQTLLSSTHAHGNVFDFYHLVDQHGSFSLPILLHVLLPSQSASEWMPFTDAKSLVPQCGLCVRSALSALVAPDHGALQQFRSCDNCRQRASQRAVRARQLSAAMRRSDVCCNSEV